MGIFKLLTAVVPVVTLIGVAVGYPGIVPFARPAAVPASGAPAVSSALASTGSSPKLHQQPASNGLDLSSETVLNVKLAEDSGIRARGNKLVLADPSKNSAALESLQSTLEAFGVKKLDRLFQGDEAKLDADQVELSKKSGKKLKNLNTWLRVNLENAKAEELAAALEQHEAIETAYPEPVAALAASLDYTPKQRYRSPAPGGVDASYALSSNIPGAKGDRVKVADVEFEWRRSHEDISKLRDPASASPTPECTDGQWRDHGTAVASIISGDVNGFGVTGIAPAATFLPVSMCATAVATAIDAARQNTSAGDVILIEVHYMVTFADGVSKYTPVEYYQADYDAIATASAAGNIVVEVAGNGDNNLDDPGRFGSVFGPAGRPDSGAIMVGAGAASTEHQTDPAESCWAGIPPRSRLDFSNYGSRVDVQNWGHCVYAAGYGNITNTTIEDLFYTSNFGGTSSASAITTGVVASLSSAYETKHGIAPAPGYIRNLLKQTGTPQDTTSQNGLSGHIGPLPDMKAALTAIAGAPVPGPEPTPGAKTVTVKSSADATVKAASPNSNYGSSSEVETDTSPLTHGLLKFSVSGTAGYTVGSAKLRLYVDNATTGAVKFFKTASTSWSESSVNWNNAPAAAATAFGSIASSPDGQWVEVDASSVISGDGTYSIRMISSVSDGVVYATKEASINRPPELVLSLVPVQSLTFAPVADASVKQASASTNYGGSSVLNADADAAEQFLMKFTVSGSAGRTVKNAKLRLYVTNPSPAGGNFYKLNDNSWSEGSVTWSNAPAASTSLLASLGAVTANTWVEVDVTSVVTGDGTFSLRTSSTSSDGADYNSKEASTNKPQLIVTY